MPILGKTSAWQAKIEEVNEHLKRPVYIPPAPKNNLIPVPGQMKIGTSATPVITSVPLRMQ
jgi:hypothetical protein